MSHLRRSPDLVEYIWPCGYDENVHIKPAPAIPFIPVDFPLPLTKPVDQFTDSEKSGIPALRKCCKCGEKYPIFQIPDGCRLCNHSFRDPCSNCTILGFCGLHEIATVELKVTGGLDQTPEYWRCRRCEDIHPFQSEDQTRGSNAFLAPKGIRCKRCSEPFHESNWVISPFQVYLGSWDGKTVAESGPWHWSLAWHQDMPAKRAIHHGKEGCYLMRDNGRPREAIPWVGKSSQQSRSRSPSPSQHSRATGASLAKIQIRHPAADLYPPPLFSGYRTLSQETSKTPRDNISRFKSPPPPSEIGWNIRPLPPLPPIPKDVKAYERGRSQTRRGINPDLITDQGPSRLQLQVQNSHKERGRSHELAAKPGNFNDARNIRPSKSHIFQGSTSTQTISIPQPQSTPAPQLPTIPKIAIQPDSPAVERARIASAATPPSSYPSNHVAAAMNKTNTPSTTHTKTHNQHKRARSPSIVAPTRTPSTQTPSKTPSRTPPRYSLFPAATTSRPATPDYHRRPSVPVNNSRPQTASGYDRGHSRSRSEGHPPGTYISRDINGEMIFTFPADGTKLGESGGEHVSEGGSGSGDGHLSVQEEVPVSGWYADEDEEGEDEDEKESESRNRSRSHSRRRTLANALKPRNWF